MLVGGGAVSDRQPSPLKAWIRDNLALTIFVCSLIFGSIGFLIATTAKVTTVQRDIADSAGKIVVLQGNIVDVDRRINTVAAEARQAEADITQRIGDLRDKEHDAEADIIQKINDANTQVKVLQAVLGTIADRTAREPLSQPKGGVR